MDNREMGRFCERGKQAVQALINMPVGDRSPTFLINRKEALTLLESYRRDVEAQASQLSGVVGERDSYFSALKRIQAAHLHSGGDSEGMDRIETILDEIAALNNTGGQSDKLFGETCVTAADNG